jgi:hypothetical protein
MTTLNEMIEIITAENPTLRIGDDKTGYTDLSVAEYEATIAEWAENRLAKLAKIAEAEAAKAAEEAAKQQAFNDAVAAAVAAALAAQQAPQE